ncbi:MAG: hypothetical protein JSW73_05245 [Candidatus Woesearchaeota archaeon]|nr:MAG: hypothetical protein JSW73_05245 [Candidatus Woesearchaeota archaeon]
MVNIIATDVDIVKEYSHGTEDKLKLWREYTRKKSDNEKIDYYTLAEKYHRTPALVWHWIKGCKPPFAKSVDHLIENHFLEDITPEEELLENKTYALVEDNPLFRNLRELSLDHLLSSSMKSGFLYPTVFIREDQDTDEIRQYLEDISPSKINDVDYGLKLDDWKHVSKLCFTILGFRGLRYDSLKEWPNYLKNKKLYRREFLRKLYCHMGKLQKNGNKKRVFIWVPTVKSEDTSKKLAADVIDWAKEITNVELKSTTRKRKDGQKGYTTCIYSSVNDTIDFLDGLLLKI